jgi:hypothetical protein
MYTRGFSFAWQVGFSSVCEGKGKGDYRNHKLLQYGKKIPLKAFGFQGDMKMEIMKC